MSSSLSEIEIVDSVEVRKGGRWFEPSARPICFRGLMTVTAIGFIPLSPQPIESTIVMWEKESVVWKEYYAEYWLKEI